MKTLADTSNPPIDLREFDADFARAESRPPTSEPGFEEIPDGIYDAQIEDVTLNRTSTTGNPMIVWKLRIQGPQCQGRALSKVRVITSKTVSFLKEDLDRLDIQMERLSEIYGRLDEMIDRPVRVFKKTNLERRWSDVYFLRARKGPQSESATEEAWRTGTTDDLPF